MLETLKIIHFLALAVGLGGGVANAIVGAKITSQAPPLGGPVQRLLGRLSFVALIVLWLTGLWMAFGTTGLDGSVWFWIKIIVVLAMTTAAVAAQVAQMRGTATPDLMKKLGMGITAGAALAVVFAVLAFS